MNPRNIARLARDLGGQLGYIRQHHARPHPLKQSDSEATFWLLIQIIMDNIRKDNVTLDLTRFIGTIEDEAMKKAAEYRDNLVEA
jgi:hypothetical protein